ncbi:MAG: hypothetical protein ACR2KT_10835 [Methylocella sp.]
MMNPAGPVKLRGGVVNATKPKYVMWALIVAISLLVFVGSLAGLLFKSTRGKAKRYAWMSALAMILAGGFFASEQDDEARRLGFSDNDDRRAATEAGVTDPAAWRAAKEGKRQAQQALAVKTTAVTPQVSSQRVETDVGQATNIRAPGANGRARVCATKDMDFDSYREIKLPTKTVFKDSGHFEGDVRDPWRPGDLANDDKWAAFITTDPVTLTKTKPCAETGIRMLVGKQFKEPSASAADRRVWQIEDVLEYSLSSGRPPVEFGKLIDDISVRAVLLTDAGDPLTLAKDETDEALKAATCLAEAQKVAAHEGAVAGRQTGTCSSHGTSLVRSLRRSSS